MTRPALLGIGAAHPDRRARSNATFVPHVSNPGIMKDDMGGAVFNALRNAARHDVDCTLISVRGGDGSGQAVEQAIAAAGLRDRSVTFLDRSTPTYTALLDGDGGLVGAVADMALYEHAFPRVVARSSVAREIARADALLVDANLPEDALGRLASMAGHKPVFAIAVSPAKAVRLRALMPLAGCVFMNAAEARAIGDGASLQDLARLIGGAFVVTAGDGPLVGRHEDDVLEIDPLAVDVVADVTGAGDALAGTAIAFLLHGAVFTDALCAGIAAAGLTVGAHEAVAQFDKAVFGRAVARVPQPRIIAPNTRHKE